MLKAHSLPRDVNNEASTGVALRLPARSTTHRVPLSIGHSPRRRDSCERRQRHVSVPNRSAELQRCPVGVEGRQDPRPPATGLVCALLAGLVPRPSLRLPARSAANARAWRALFGERKAVYPTSRPALGQRQPACRTPRHFRRVPAPGRVRADLLHHGRDAGRICGDPALDQSPSSTLSRHPPECTVRQRLAMVAESRLPTRPPAGR